LSEIVKKNDIHIALSGGMTPKSIYSYLSKTIQPYIQWDNVRFYWGDERCVPPNHPESNFLMAQKSLLEKIKVPEENIFRILGENDPDVEQERYGKLITANNKGIFDLILLGLGSDGHTASIFPDQMHLLHSKNVCERAIHPETGQQRITLSGNTINTSKNILFIVTGTNKSNIVRDIFYQSGQWLHYPASFVKPKQGKMEWLLDEEAAADL
jgi:6-phosphogluconolactonase